MDKLINKLSQKKDLVRIIAAVLCFAAAFFYLVNAIVKTAYYNEYGINADSLFNFRFFIILFGLIGLGALLILKQKKALFTIPCALLLLGFFINFIRGTVNNIEFLTEYSEYVELLDTLRIIASILELLCFFAVTAVTALTTISAFIKGFNKYVKIVVIAIFATVIGAIFFYHIVPVVTHFVYIIDYGIELDAALWIFEDFEELSYYIKLYLIPNITFTLIPLALGISALFLTLAETTDSATEDGAAAQTQGATANKTVNNASPYYIDILKHVLLLFFTFGIWMYIWIYKTTEYTNQKSATKRDSMICVLISLFFPIYVIYWAYVTAQCVDEISKAKGRPSDTAMITLIVALVVSIVAPIYIQNNINQIETLGATQSAPESEPQPEVQPVKAVDNTNQTAKEYNSVDLIKKYKDLLDDGAITQEEFDAKKKEILGL
ncbi:MAG: DUF4234 domain-containing protein [Clostridia bacterium]|nr:DUF4234 domain-containing protein [Clostridia bacterium]